MAGFHHFITTWQGGVGGGGVGLGLQRGTVLLCATKIEPSIARSRLLRKGAEQKPGTGEGLVGGHQTVDDINPWEARPVVITILEFCM